jgi:CubicO group peptidase (beta-lactamase class C family)
MALQAELDRLLQAAVDAGDVPGVVALAATADGVIYQGAAGRRRVPDGAPMSLDTMFWIASMTKPVAAVAAMQLVEKGKLSLEQNAAEILPQLADVRVLEGFDHTGAPRLRRARRPITVRHLLTHTAGYGYEHWNADMRRYVQQTGLPGASGGRLVSLDAPLLFDPGERWEYGISIDWLGRLVDAVSGKTLNATMREHIFEPLGMHDTVYLLDDEHSARLASLHRRANGTLAVTDERKPPEHLPEFFPGGGGLHGTGSDYLKFLRALLNGGRLDGARILRPETVALMGQNHIAVDGAGVLKAANPHMTHDLDAFPGQRTGWGLSFLINLEDAPTGRRAGSLTWAGMGNTYFWLDPKRKVAGVLLTQILPFADPIVLRLFAAFETAVYRAVDG